ncbi:MAG: hypothetical protein H7Y31_07890 [Chitinophagaceae bacterium]|nr:hypothetical protein [Chitinophagaceae bacterium]
MRGKKNLWLMLLLMSAFAAASQVESGDWKEAKLFLRTQTQPVRNAKELRLLGNAIEKYFPDTMNRVRASYLWVVDNLQYDCQGMKAKKSRWALDSVLKSRKAVCAGYVNVFRNLCDAAGVECVDVSGYGRSGFSDLVLTRPSFAANHTWNAVRINNEWKLIDVTWASGYTDEDCNSFTNARNDWYFCAEPKRFGWDHFPKDDEWQLLKEPISWSDFYTYPLLYQGMLENNIEEFSPRSVVIHKQVGDTVVFNFKSQRSLNRIIISSRTQPGIYMTDYPDRTSDGYRYVYKIRREGSYDLQIDLLNIENPRGFGSYEVKTYTDIVYWINVRPTNSIAKDQKAVF